MNARSAQKMQKRIYVSNGAPTAEANTTICPVTQGDLAYDYTNAVAYIAITGSDGQDAIFTAVSL